MKFLSELRKDSNLSRSARTIQVSNQTVWNWRNNDPEFDMRVKEALAIGVECVESDTISNARNHYDENGDLKKEGNPLLHIFLLKSHKPNVYGDKKKIEIEGKKEKIVVVPARVIDQLEDAQIEEATLLNGTESK